MVLFRQQWSASSRWFLVRSFWSCSSAGWGMVLQLRIFFGIHQEASTLNSLLLLSIASFTFRPQFWELSRYCSCNYSQFLWNFWNISSIDISCFSLLVSCMLASIYPTCLHPFTFYALPFVCFLSVLSWTVFVQWPTPLFHLSFLRPLHFLAGISRILCSFCWTRLVSH